MLAYNRRSLASCFRGDMACAGARGGSGALPQRGPGAKPLVNRSVRSGAKPTEAEHNLTITLANFPGILILFRLTSFELSCPNSAQGPKFGTV